MSAITQADTLIERSNAMNARWNAGSGTAHGEFILSKFRYANRRADPSLTKEYEERLGHIPLTELAAVWAQLQNPDYSTAIVPSIEAVLKTHTRRKRLQREKVSEAKQHKAKATIGERDVAMAAARGAYCNRICKSQGLNISLVASPYSGDFPFKDLADNLALPKIPEDDGKHDRYWAEFEKAFNQQWGSYAG